MPTANYAAELFEIFKRAARETYEITLPDKREAFSLRYRLNKLRSEMRKEQHYMLEIAEGVNFIIRKPLENVLICQPADQGYLKAIRDAIGAPSEEAIKAQEAFNTQQQQQQQPSAQPRITSEEALEEFFSTTRKETGQ